MSILSRILASAALLSVAASLALPARALTLTPADRGTIHLSRSFANISLQHSAADTAMTLVNFGLVSGGVADRAYALFKVPTGLLPPTFSASVQLVASPGDGGAIPYGISLFDISSSPLLFQFSFSGPATPGSQALFDDLGSGVAYGSASIVGGPHTLTFALPTAATNAMALASQIGGGGVFGIGFSGGALSLTLTAVTLEVTAVSAVPEPGSGLLWAAGLASLLRVIRRNGARRHDRPGLITSQGRAFH